MTFKDETDAGHFGMYQLSLLQGVGAPLLHKFVLIHSPPQVRPLTRCSWNISLMQ
jgi:hypothetical protein